MKPKTCKGDGENDQVAAGGSYCWRQRPARYLSGQPFCSRCPASDAMQRIPCEAISYRRRTGVTSGSEAARRTASPARATGLAKHSYECEALANPALVAPETIAALISRSAWPKEQPVHAVRYRLQCRYLHTFGDTALR